MSFNIWGGGLNENKSVVETVAAIRAANADLVGLQEVSAESGNCQAQDCPAVGETVTEEIARALGYEYLEQSPVSEANWNNAILSRFPIVAETPHGLGAHVDLGDREAVLLNIHLSDYPYQPYQLTGIEYGAAAFIDNAQEAVQQARVARRNGLKVLARELDAIDSGMPVFLTGDLNEPSHRDWTDAAVEAGHHPMAVPFPTTRWIEARGFRDLLREVHPDEVEKPAFTWTPRRPESEPGEHHDRIDYVFGRGAGMKVAKVEVVGEKSPPADIVVRPWPSDHRAVVAEVCIP